jgi:hypothetical protein
MVLATLSGKNKSNRLLDPFWNWGSTVRQQYRVLHLGHSDMWSVANIHTWDIGWVYGQKQQQYAPSPILNMGVNGASLIVCLASWLMNESQCSKNSYTMSWQTFHPKQCLTYLLHHYENEHQQSINNFWSFILGNQGIVWIHQLITELLTAFVV